MKHALSEAVGRSECPPQIQLLRRLVIQPRRAQLPLDVFAEEQMAEQELVLGDRFLRYHQRQWPFNLVSSDV